MIAVHAWAPTRLKALSFASVVFMGLLAGLTSSLHFVILTVSRQPELVRQSWLPLVLGFKWPSIVYALDILGWDVFFAVSMLFAAPVFGGSRLAVWIRWLMATAGILAHAGLSGVAFGDLQLRNIGIVGYGPVFLVVAAVLASSSTERHPAITQPISVWVPGAGELPESTSSGSAGSGVQRGQVSDRGARFPSMTRRHVPPLSSQHSSHTFPGRGVCSADSCVRLR